MKEFPAFMLHAANRIATASQSTPGVEGYVFDGADGSQMAFWTCRETTSSAPHAHEFDEYLLVVEGRYTLIFYPSSYPSIHPSSDNQPPEADQKISLKAGDEYFIQRDVLHGGEVIAGTRTIHAFGGKRAERAREGTRRES